MRQTWAVALLLGLLGCKPRPTVCEPLAYTTASGGTVPATEIQARPYYVTLRGSEEAVVEWVSFGHVYTSKSIRLLPGDGGLSVTIEGERSFSVTRAGEAVTILFPAPRCVDPDAHGGFCTKYSQDEQLFVAQMTCRPMPLRQLLRE